jgi:hypothetical protein
MSGRIYDISEISRTTSFLDTQEEELQKIDSEGSDKKVIKYAILIGASIIFLVLFKIIVNKRKK